MSRSRRSRGGGGKTRYVDISKTSISWEWYEYGKYVEWGEPQSSQIEAEYQKYQKTGRPRHFSLQAKNRNNYRIDFQKMTQENTNSYYSRRLRRTEKKEPKKRVNVAILETMWTKYYDEEEEGMSGEMIMQFCEDLGINPGDVNLLILFWCLKADQKYFLTKDQFVMGLAKLGMENDSKIKAGLRRMKQKVVDEKDFRKFYLWLFDYFRDQGAGVRTIPLETATQTWELVFSKRYKWIKEWCDFYTNEVKHAVNKDTWKMFLDFTNDPKFKSHSDFKEYNIDFSVYPSAIDEFIEYMQKK